MELHDSFNPVVDSIDVHLERQLGKWTGPTFDALDVRSRAEILFIQQTDSHCLKKMLDELCCVFLC